MNIQDVTNRTIFLAITGSHAYGLSTPESDIDYRGVCIPTEDYFLGLKKFEQQEYPGEDKVVYDIRKAIKLISDANPNMLELLFINNAEIWTDYWSTIVENRDLFLSSKIRFTYAGYAFAQLKRIKCHKQWIDNPIKEPTREQYGLAKESSIPKDLIMPIIASSDYIKEEYKVIAIKEKSYLDAKKNWDNYREWITNRNKKRYEIEKKFGYDCKHASHLVRLMRQGEELLTTGNLTVNRSGIDADELLSIKNGSWSYEEVIKYAESMDNKFDKLYKDTCLPRSVNINKINELCVDLCQDYLNLIM